MADIWSTKARYPYLAITAHWIHRDKSTNGLQLCSTLIVFQHPRGSHNGARLARIALHLLDRVGVTVSTLQCPTYSCRNPVIPAEFRWNPQEFRWNPAGIQSFHWNSAGIKQIKVEILYLTLHFVLIYRTTYLSLLSLLFLHLFKSVSHLQSVYSRTLPLGYNFK